MTTCILHWYGWFLQGFFLISVLDVIFFIYLYQRYIYRIDPKRVNEFGTSQEMMDNPETALAEGEGAEDGGNLAIEGGEEEQVPAPKSEAEKKED